MNGSQVELGECFQLLGVCSPLMFVGSVSQVSLEWSNQDFRRACKMPELIEEHVTDTFLPEKEL